MKVWNNFTIVTDKVAQCSYPTGTCINIYRMLCTKKTSKHCRVLIIFPDSSFLAGMRGKSLDMAKGEFQKCDTSFSVLSSWVKGQLRWLRLCKGLGMDTSEFHTRHQPVSGWRQLWLGISIFSVSQHFRHGCQPKNFGGILTLHLNWI